MKKTLPVIIILVLSLVTHFAFFGHPNETVFDEVHFGKFISGYFTHEYFFDIHPPLGKLLISGMGYLTNFQPGFSFAQIGEKFPDQAYLWLRLLPAIAGSLLPVIIYLLALELGISRMAALAGGILIALENSFVVQSRLILLDSFLLLFGFTALWCYLRWRNLGGQGQSRWYLAASGLLAGLSMSVKWTGMAFLAIIVIAELFHLWQDRRGTAWRRLKAIIFCLAIAPIFIYTATFVIHLKLLTKTGQGDAFMTQQFRKTLAGSPESKDDSVKPLSFFEKFIELNTEMYKANATLSATHPYSSQWFSWPFMARPIYYWYQKTSDTTDSKIYFLGNPVIWWASTLAILYFLMDKVYGQLKRRILNLSRAIIAGGFIINLLPFVGIKRAMFLYHYMSAYIFAILALIYLIDKLKNKKTVLMVLILSSVVLFIFFAPLTYGLPLSAKAYSLRAWLPSWK